MYIKTYFSVSLPPQDLFQTVVCISTPRMYPQRRYFLVVNKSRILEYCRTKIILSTYLCIQSSKSVTFSLPFKGNNSNFLMNLKRERNKTCPPLLLQGHFCCSESKTNCYAIFSSKLMIFIMRVIKGI